jgi:O-antigen/teichoic acid export membrane protein
LLFVALGVASSQYLIIEGLTQVSLQRTAIGAVVNVVLNVLWIPDYGAIGAAWATLISYGIATFWLIQGPRSFTCMRLMARGLLPVKA